MTERTTVHLLRHGEVHNPGGVLYGRLPEFHLSDLGQEMAERDGRGAGRPRHHRRDRLPAGAGAADRGADRRGARPADRRDADLIEADNMFEGKRVGGGDGVLRGPQPWRHLWNPVRPSWGEPYREIAARMRTRRAPRPRRGPRPRGPAGQPPAADLDLPPRLGGRQLRARPSQAPPVQPRLADLVHVRRRRLRRRHLHRAVRGPGGPGLEGQEPDARCCPERPPRPPPSGWSWRCAAGCSAQQADAGERCRRRRGAGLCVR